MSFSSQSANNDLPGKECVILLHGLARTSTSMNKLEKRLLREGYVVVNYDYPSRKATVEELAGLAITEALALCEQQARVSRTHFITHSMGGILVRCYLADHDLPKLGRVVMLSPPNRGSEVIDKLSDVPGFRSFHGLAGLQLGTRERDIPKTLGEANFELGIITGNRSINPLLSLLIPGSNDGKVSLESARLEGMADFLVLPHTHPFIMKSDKAIAQSIYFLKHGRFQR